MASDFLYGLFYMQVGFRSSTGYFSGTETDPDNITPDTTTHALLLRGPVDYTPPDVTRDTATDQGGQKIRAQAQLGPSDFGTGTITLSELDDDFYTKIVNATVDAAIMSGWRQFPANINVVSPPRFYMIISTKAQTVTATLDSTDVWSHWIWPNVQFEPAMPSASQSGGVNPSPLEYTFTPSRSLRSLSGELFSIMAMSMEDNSDLMYRIQTPNPISATLWVQDAIAVTYTVGYRPTTNDVAAASNSFTNNGVLTTPTSISVTTGVVVIPSAGTSGDNHLAVYETTFVAI